MDDAGRPTAGAEAALQPPPAHPRGRDRGPGEAARLEGPAHRGRRARRPGGALPRRRRRRDDRDRRLRRRRPVEPPAPGHPLDRPRRREEDRLGSQDDQRPEPRREGRGSRGDARGRQRRPAHRRLRCRPRRDRHVRDALHPQRRRRRREHPRRPRERLPLRGPADRLPAVRGPVLPLPLPDPAAAGARARLLRGRRAGRRARDHGPAPGQRGPEDPARDRGHARGDDCSCSMPSTARSPSCKLKRDPKCPVCSDAAVEARKAGRSLSTTSVGADAPFALGGSWGAPASGVRA